MAGQRSNMANSAENGVLNDMSLCVIDAGEGDKGSNWRVTPLASRLQTAIYEKALRRVGVYLGLLIGDRQFKCLRMIDAWCLIHHREGAAKTTIVDWSGKMTKWKAQMYNSIEDLIRMELLETVRISTGERICITQKGYRVLETLRRFEDIIYNELALKYNEKLKDKKRTYRPYALVTNRRAKKAA